MAESIRYVVARWKPGGPADWALIIESKRRSRGVETLTTRTTTGRLWPKAGNATAWDVLQELGRELEIDPEAVALAEVGRG